jgi:hypothetical protein
MTVAVLEIDDRISLSRRLVARILPLTLDNMTVAVLEIDERLSVSRRLVAHSHNKLFLRPVSGEVIGDVRFLDRERRSVTARARFMSTIRRM